MKIAVFALDTSGGISEQMFHDFIGEVNDLIQKTEPDQTFVLQCDTEIRSVTNLEMKELVPFNLKLKGGGGTLFEPVLKWIEQNNINPEFLVYFTDGFCPEPTTTVNYEVVWKII